MTRTEPAGPHITVVATANGIGPLRPATADEYLLLRRPGDHLAPDALEVCRRVLAADPAIDVLLTDADELQPDGSRGRAFHTCGWSPERLRSQDHLWGLLLLRRTLVDELDDLGPSVVAGTVRDLVLRVTERARVIAHLPRVLVHREPGARPVDAAADARAVQGQCDRLGIPAEAVVHDADAGLVRLEPRLRQHPKVSVVVLTAGSRRVVHGQVVDLVDQCLRSVLDRSTYSDVEIVVVVDGRSEPGLEDRLVALDPHRVRAARNHAPFNFSEACNLGADHASGDVLVFLNDDTEVVTADWLERLVLFATTEGVGAVGPRLLFGDGRIQHAGIVGRRGEAGHRAVGFPGDHHGYLDSLRVTTNVLAVTGACLAVTRSHFDLVGGFDPVFPLNFNDVDLCLRLLRHGLRTVVDPHTVLVHHESATRTPGVAPDELDAFQARWRTVLADDPFDNPHLRSVSLEDVPPNPTLLRLRELTGSDDLPVRRWPFRVDPPATAPT